MQSSHHNVYSYMALLYTCSQLLTWGAGKFGQLGNNDREDGTAQNIARYIPQESGRVVQVYVRVVHHH